MNSAKPSFSGNQASTALSQQFNTIQCIDGKRAEMAVTGFDQAKTGLEQASPHDRRASGQQSFRIRKFSRQGSLSSRRSESARSQRDNNDEFNERGLSTTARKIAKDMTKTIDSDDEDGIVQHRERSRATR